MYDLERIEKIYQDLKKKIDNANKILGRPMTLCEKILYAHFSEQNLSQEWKRGKEYVNFSPDRVAMQDATAQMALLQFMNAGRKATAVPTTVHCDHLIIAKQGASNDLKQAITSNHEVYDFLQSVSSKFGIGFWKPGAGIIHQVVLENYAFPGGMMIGTDSHTPNAGGLGMIAIGVGGADAVDVMAGMPWELKMPEIIGVELTGKLNGWTSPKDVILKLAGILTVKGGTNSVIEYFGEGTRTISATGKATICNMGAEVGATTSIFPYDEQMATYLRATSRSQVANAADSICNYLKADAEVESDPEQYFDKVIRIDLSTLEPYINGPFTPDAAHTISEFATYIKQNNYPQQMEVGLIGSCTNSSYEDLGRAASIARQAIEKNLDVKAKFIINPGSERVLQSASADGYIKDFEDIGGIVMTNACGPCIGQWNRNEKDNTRPNSILTSFNRNFAKRADGNPQTHAFVASPEIVTALTIAGDLCFNPLKDTLLSKDGKQVKLDPPVAEALPKKEVEVKNNGYLAPENNALVDVVIDPKSQRLQKLQPFAPLNPADFQKMALLIKTQGKCTTDHISMAGSWLRFRGHLENISDNLLMGAVNAFNEKTNCVFNPVTKKCDAVSTVAKDLKQKGISSIVIAEENYGEGSSREHAAMEPRFLNVKVVLAKSFARIHETNLKKQGMLALTFVDKTDYDRIREDDTFSIPQIDIKPRENLWIEIHHADGTNEKIEANHTYNNLQIEWLKAGSALNYKE